MFTQTDTETDLYRDSAGGEIKTRQQRETYKGQGCKNEEEKGAKTSTKNMKAEQRRTKNKRNKKTNTKRHTKKD